MNTLAAREAFKLHVFMLNSSSASDMASSAPATAGDTTLRFGGPDPTQR